MHIVCVCAFVQVNQFDDVIPFYYAWFLNDSSSKQLCFIAECLLKECVQQFPAFSDRLLKQLHISAAELQQLYESTSDASDVTGMFLLLSSFKIFLRNIVLANWCELINNDVLFFSRSTCFQNCH